MSIRERFYESSKMPTYKLTLEYDGTAYAGWQRQPNQLTIQRMLEEALFQISQIPTSTVAAGRTDAGVHAYGQVVSFQSAKELSPEEWTRSLNGVLPKDICVRQTERVSDDFHARYSAKLKTYEYRILNHPVRPALERFRTWHVPKPLDLFAMKEAIQALLGKYDFSSFEGSPTDNQNPICHMSKVAFDTELPHITITLIADRFLKQMVRAIIGTLVEVGQGKRASTDMKTILEAHDRRMAGKTAPPHGLFLMQVNYDEESKEDKRIL